MPRNWNTTLNLIAEMSHQSSFFTYCPVASSTTWIFTMGCEIIKSVLRRSVLWMYTPRTRLSSKTGFWGASDSASLCSLTTTRRENKIWNGSPSTPLFNFNWNLVNPENYRAITMFFLLLFLLSFGFCFIFHISIQVCIFILIPGGKKRRRKKSNTVALSLNITP